MWQWYNYIRASCGAEKPFLHINLDETSVCQWMKLRLGNIAGQGGRGSAQHRAVASKGAQRRYVSFLAAICDRPEVQPRLPQLVCLAEGACKVADVAALNRESLPAHVCLRRASSWLDRKLFTDYIGVLLTNLGQEIMDAYRVVIFFDTAQAHLAPTAFARCQRAGVHFVIIPSLTTSMLQPLDTHVFSRYKTVLRQKYAEAQVHSVSGHALPVRRVVELIWSAWEAVVPRVDVARIFADNGFCFEQRAVRPSILAAMGAEARDRELRKPEPTTVVHVCAVILLAPCRCERPRTRRRHP